MTNSSGILTNLKPKSLNFYCEKSPTGDKIQRYRKVFDSEEIKYLYVDFIFFNKFFDEKNWSDEIIFKANLLYDDGKKELASLKSDLEVLMSENEVIVTQSWGSDEPGSWDQGHYNWEVWYGDELLIEEDFYIENFGVVDRENNPYFDFLNLKLFEASSTIPALDQRTYLTRFPKASTRYIWAELEIQDMHPGIEWKGEFTFIFYNDVKEVIARIEKIETVISINKNNTFTVYAGTGSNTQQTWEKDIYSVEVIFMEMFIASARFEVGDTAFKGKLILDVPSRKKGEGLTPGPDKNKSEQLIFQEIDSLIGLREIKEKLHEYYYYVKYLKLRNEKGLEKIEDLNLNFVFTGNPGTGKTTVAKLLGEIYKDLGLLKKSAVFEVDRGDLVGRYIGETAPQTKEVIEKARGGILFIDEAYSLWRGESDERDFGREAVEALVKELSDGPGDIAVIVAGYPAEMKKFIESNPGLSSRFNIWYDFPDYLPDELLDIGKLIASKKYLSLTKEAEKILKKIIIDAYRKRDKHFGNARFVSSKIEEAQVNLGLRVMKMKDPDKLSVKEISTLRKEDIEKLVDESQNRFTNFPVDELLLKKSMNELNSLIGLSKVKTEVKELVKLVKFYKECKKDVLGSLSLHNVFIGNPGTGKTTVARILANIYKSLGLLERGHLVETSRDSLVAGYIGQTAIKTKEKIESAAGGVLFIDEAYSLGGENGGEDFGGEAVEVILKAMEDRRGNFSLIAAGYPDEMLSFLNSNPGLKSRFDNVLEFEDLDTEDLTEALTKMLKENGMSIEKSALEYLTEYFDFHFQNKDRFFGNARFVRKVVDRIVRNQNLRLANLSGEKRTDKIISTIALRDVEEFKPQKGFLTKERRRIGF